MKTDVFSAGVTMFAMFYNKMPFFQATSTDKFYRLIIEKSYDKFWSMHGVPPCFQENASEMLPLFKELFLEMVS